MTSAANPQAIRDSGAAHIPETVLSSFDGTGATEQAATPAPAAAPARPSAPPGRWLVRGTVAALLVATAVLYLWGLNESGYANSFYSAAAQAGSQSWQA
ncbi:hypothetical protein ACQCX5_11340 [Propionibacteriaceae bacterium G57]|uniref:hypothetical protein n=1 Tax=Aestuariimicrobium sp. G57 TaxID=3418485 RepID=UPI003DA6DB46